MRRSQARVGLLCKLAPKLRFPSVSYKSYWKRSSDSYRLWRQSTQTWLGDKQTRKAEPYILPRLIVDLDAHDSPYVKKIEDLPAAETINLIRGHDRAGKCEDEFGAKEIELRGKREMYRGRRSSPPRNAHSATSGEIGTPLRQRADALDPFRMTVSPTDLLLYAIRGYPTNVDKQKRLEFPNISRLLNAHNVTPIDNARVGTRSLIYDFTKDGETVLKNAQFTPEREHIISQALSSCNSWYDFRKTVFMLASTDPGRKYLSQKGGGAIIGYLRQASRNDLPSNSSLYIRLAKALRFLNHLTFNMTSKGDNIGDRLCNAGIYYATQGASLPALKKYLQVSVDNNYRTDGKTRAAFHLVFRAIFSPADVRLRLQLGKEDREELQRFLTGWKTDDGPDSGGEKQNCFADFFTKHYFTNPANFSLYYNYILGLAIIGWKNSLRREFLHLENINPSMFSAEKRSQLFATAYAIAKDSNTALTFLEKIPPPSSAKNASDREDNMSDTTESDLANSQRLDSDSAPGKRNSIDDTVLHTGRPLKAMISVMLPVFHILHGYPPDNSRMQGIPSDIPLKPREVLTLIEKLFDVASLVKV